MDCVNKKVPPICVHGPKQIVTVTSLILSVRPWHKLWITLKKHVHTINMDITPAIYSTYEVHVLISYQWVQSTYHTQLNRLQLAYHTQLNRLQLAYHTQLVALGWPESIVRFAKRVNTFYSSDFVIQSEFKWTCQNINILDQCFTGTAVSSLKCPDTRPINLTLCIDWNGSCVQIFCVKYFYIFISYTNHPSAAWRCRKSFSQRQLCFHSEAMQSLANVVGNTGWRT